jgi:hypothetical protein
MYTMVETGLRVGVGVVSQERGNVAMGVRATLCPDASRGVVLSEDTTTVSQVGCPTQTMMQ